MTNLERFDIDLKGMETDRMQFSYDLTDDFFQAVNSNELSKGSLKADVMVRKSMQAFEITVKCNGYVMVPCDRCLDDMKLDINTEDSFIAKFGDRDDYEDEIITISEAKGTISLAWLICEFISLAIPIQHIHEEGECNIEMAEKLKRHTASGSEDDSDENPDRPIDPRWEELRKILDNN